MLLNFYQSQEGKKSEMLELILIRHGQTDWNLNGHVMGRQAVPLNDTGRAQAENVARYLASAKIDYMVSSPVARAMETSRIIALPHEELKIVEDGAFSELDYGDWVNCTFEELPTRFPEEWKRYRTDLASASFTGGESVRSAAARITAAVDRLLAMQGVERAIIVSHADPIKIALTHVLGLSLESIMRFVVDNCAVVLVRYSDEVGPRLVIANTSMGFGRDMKMTDMAAKK